MDRDIKDMEEVSELDLMREFMKLTDRTVKETELTVNDFMEYMKVTRNRARYLLAKYEADGLLKCRKVSVNQSSVNAYSPAKGTWKDVVETLKREE